VKCKCKSCKTCAKKDATKKYAEGGLKRWFKEEWTKPDGSECGSNKGKEDAKCRPSKKVNSKTPVTWGEMSESQKKKAVADKNKATRAGKQFSKYRLKRK
jgi:hypothetical protein